MLEKLKTLTGVPAQEIGDRLEKPFTDPKAYSKIKGGAGGAANLTADDLSGVACELENIEKFEDLTNGIEILEKLEREFSRLEVYARAR